MRIIVCLLGLVLLWPVQALDASGPDFAKQRAELAAEIEEQVRQTSRHIGRDHFHPEVLRAIAEVERHLFVPEKYRDQAYENRPLPIGFGQTISQPYIVALMTDLLDPDPGDTVLEVGTGSGYQAAVLARLVKEVVTIEIIPDLARQARDRFKRLGLENIRAVTGDGYFGYPEAAPYEAIVVTAAGDHIPPPLIEQLKPGGRMVLPVGGPFSVQQLTLVSKTGDGTVRTEHLLPVRFVPLTGGH
ncbi:MAG: protein-L-isoaspartate(D-aspartate) O-methyltransferase [Thermodesulfobacteriota bacterium]